MTKQELVERIAEGSPVVIGVPVGKKIRYVNLNSQDLLKSLKGVRRDIELPCSTVGRDLPREKTQKWIVFFDVVGLRK